MKINDIEKIINNDDIVEILIGVELDPDNSNIWELEAPNALVTYECCDNLEYHHMELVDRGMRVHGHEFTEHEEEEILNYLETKNIGKKIELSNNSKLF